MQGRISGFLNQQGWGPAMSPSMVWCPLPVPHLGKECDRAQMESRRKPVTSANPATGGGIHHLG